MSADAFAPYTLAADLLEVRRVYTAFFAQLRPSDWSRPTEARRQGWTLQETVIHLEAVLVAYQQMVADTLAGRPARIPGLEKRTDLPAWNQQAITLGKQLSMDAVCESLLRRLHDFARCAASLTPAECHKTMVATFINGSPSVAELIGGQIVHTGLVHAAQVANGAGLPPLWRQFDAPMMQRQLMRLFRLMAFFYWPERGGKLRATMEFQIGGASGGVWHVVLAPEGGQSYTGPAQRATATMRFRDADAACRIFMMQRPLLPALFSGDMRVRGDLRLARRFAWLVTPT